MKTDNPFGMEMDEDGLPKYSPDRKNITAYHMYKLGLTDKLPDPEETHTPFFRTPSYYEEKAERERRNQAGSIPKIEAEPVKPERPDFFRRRPFALDGEGGNPSGVKPEPFAPQAGRWQGGQDGQKGQDPGDGQAGSMDGNAFGRQVLRHIFGTANPPYQAPPVDFRLSDQPVPAPLKEEMPTPAQKGDETSAPVRSPVTPRQRHTGGPEQKATPSAPASSAPSGTNGTGDTANPASLAENTMNTLHQAFGQFNNAASEEDIRAMYGYSRPPSFSGQGNAIGNAPGFSDSSQQNPSGNGSCAPLPVSPTEGIVPKKNRRLITPEETDDINAELTRKNGCKPVGINHGLLSQYEGGSQKKAYVPWSEKTAKGNSSGVTVGSGFDLGQRKHPDELRAMGLPESLVQKFAPYLGKKRADAVRFLRDHPLTLSEDETNILNRCILIDMGKKAIRHWDAEVDKQRKKWPNAPYFHEMNSDQQTIVFSRYYNEGQGWIKNHPDIHQSILNNDWDTAGKQWDEQIQRYEKSGQGWKAGRFSQEHEYLWRSKKR